MHFLANTTDMIYSNNTLQIENVSIKFNENMIQINAIYDNYHFNSYLNYNKFSYKINETFRIKSIN